MINRTNSQSKVAAYKLAASKRTGNTCRSRLVVLAGAVRLGFLGENRQQDAIHRTLAKTDKRHALGLKRSHKVFAKRAADLDHAQ